MEKRPFLMTGHDLFKVLTDTYSFLEKRKTDLEYSCSILEGQLDRYKKTQYVSLPPRLTEIISKDIEKTIDKLSLEESRILFTESSMMTIGAMCRSIKRMIEGGAL